MAGKYTPSDLQALARMAGLGGSRGSHVGTRQFRRKAQSKRKLKPLRAIPRQVKGLSNQVKELKRLAESDMGTHTHRQRIADNLVSSVNEQSNITLESVSSTRCEEVISELRYYDPASPGVLVQADGTTGSYQKEFYFKKMYSKILLRNNYQVPCNVSVYCCRPKADTNITPSSAYTNGLVDVGNPSASNPLMHLTDSVQFKDLWRIEKSKRILLEPGQYCSLSTISKPFQYDPSLFDSHVSNFMPQFQAQVWQVHVTGIMGHDTVITTEQGVLQAGVDIQVDTTFVLKYPAGADIKYFFVSDTSMTFSNVGVISNKPLADNQPYSVL